MHAVDRCNLLKYLSDNAEHLGSGMIRVDSILNHQVSPILLNYFKDFVFELDIEFTEVTKILTAEASGIAPALVIARELNVPLIFARKGQPVTMADSLSEKVFSRTKKIETNLSISSRYLKSDDSILIIDDFLGSGVALQALINLAEKTGCNIKSIVCVLEKVYENGREKLTSKSIPIHCLAQVNFDSTGLLFT